MQQEIKDLGSRALNIFKIQKLNEGKGPVCPSGSRVKVHFTGKFTDGTVFDTSLTHNRLKEFVVGTGQVIRGLDLGIIQMRKGQKAILTCPPDYAYGVAGVKGMIPPNTTIIFEVKLIDF